MGHNNIVERRDIRLQRMIFHSKFIERRVNFKKLDLSSTYFHAELHFIESLERMGSNVEDGKFKLINMDYVI